MLKFHKSNASVIRHCWLSTIWYSHTRL